ncbi:hypothetical protein BD410DRAFT_789160 [Rickenella mellea]|uniref:Uncharacterized protein n=1 Tax=Rickenella mellea TaxID=50990 RepID=A0A4Y7Q363_9AGAM|nr:hypothetical protein BD410DRAFT_789160 [Rickenella mellea]
MKAVDEVDEDGGEALVEKRARMSAEEGEERKREEKREGKKRARSDDDDDVSQTSSGDAANLIDDNHQTKRAKRSMEEGSSSHASASPRLPGRPVHVERTERGGGGIGRWIGRALFGGFEVGSATTANAPANIPNAPTASSSKN